MNDVREWKIPKWPFLLGNALLLAFAYLIVWKSPHPISQWEILACFAAAMFGAVLGILPFLLDYRAMGTALQVNALGAVTDKIQDLEKLAAQIGAATNQWDAIQGQAEKTDAGAKQIADKMGGPNRAADVRLLRPCSRCRYRPSVHHRPGSQTGFRVQSARRFSG